jgi:hypothetical protein
LKLNCAKAKGEVLGREIKIKNSGEGDRTRADCALWDEGNNKDGGSADQMVYRVFDGNLSVPDLPSGG